MTQYQITGLNKQSGDKVRALLAEAPRYPTLLMRQAAKHFVEFDGWWQGAFANEELQAVAAVENHAGNIWGRSTEAVQALADGMLRAAAGRASSGGTHQLFGEAEIIGVFWERFKGINRQKVDDRLRDLVSATEVPRLKKAYEVRPATSKDLPLVAEFLAEHSLEQWGVDPRVNNREGWERRTKEAIAGGNLLVGYQRGRPAFVGALQEHDPETGTMMLDRLHVPRPMRRPKVIAGILAHATAMALDKGNEVFFFVDADNEPWQEGAAIAGYEPRCRYRLLLLR